MLMTTTIRIELKSVKVDLKASHETYHYSAKLYADGRHVADVSNLGRGGADVVDRLGRGVSREDLDLIAQRISREHPPMNLSEPGEAPSMTEDTLEATCHRLVNAFLVRRELRKDLRRHLLYYEQGLPQEGERAELKMLVVNDAKGHTLARLRDYARGRHPGCYILNDQDEDEALVAYQRLA